MAFGKIQMEQIAPVEEKKPKQQPKTSKPVRNNQPPKPPVVPPPVTPPPVEKTPEPEEINFQFVRGDGLNSMRFAILGDTTTAAKDFLCGCYFDLMSIVQDSVLSLFTGENTTLQAISEIKQFLDHASTRPVGSQRKQVSDYASKTNFVVTLSEAGNQKESLDLHFFCGDYSRSDAVSNAEAVFVLLNMADPSVTADRVSAMASGLNRSNTYWIVYGFENEKSYFMSEYDNPVPVRIRTDALERFGFDSLTDGKVFFCQVYGGLTCENSEDGQPVYTTALTCREYMPVACELPLCMAIRSIILGRKIRSHALTNVEIVVGGYIDSLPPTKNNWYKELGGIKENDYE